MSDGGQPGTAHGDVAAGAHLAQLVRPHQLPRATRLPCTSTSCDVLAAGTRFQMPSSLDATLDSHGNFHKRPDFQQRDSILAYEERLIPLWNDSEFSWVKDRARGGSSPAEKISARGRRALATTEISLSTVSLPKGIQFSQMRDASVFVASPIDTWPTYNTWHQTPTKDKPPF